MYGSLAKVTVDAEDIASHSLTVKSEVQRQTLDIVGRDGADDTINLSTVSFTQVNPTEGDQTIIQVDGLGGNDAIDTTGMFLYTKTTDGGSSGDRITNFESHGSGGSDVLAFLSTSAGGQFGYSSTAAAQAHVYTDTADYNASNTQAASWYLDSSTHTVMTAIDCPFRAADALLAQLDAEEPDVKIRLIDFHAEATSEKCGLGWYMNRLIRMMLLNILVLGLHGWLV